MQVTLRIVSTPVAILVKRCVKIQEVREETTCRHFAGQLIEVKVTVFGQVVDTALLLPYLDGEDGRFATTHTLVGGKQYLAHDATPFSRRVRTVVDGRKHHLVATTRVDGVHVMDKGLHSLMDAPNGLVDGMLLGPLTSTQSVQRLLEIVYQGFVVKVVIVFSIQVFQILQFLNVAHADIGSQIEVESRNGLSAVHLVLCALQRYTSQHRCRLNTLGRTRGSVTSYESTRQNVIQGMLHAGQRLSRIVVLIVDVQVVMLGSITALLRKQVVVNERLGCF